MTYDGDHHDEADDLLNYGISARRVPVMRVMPDQAALQGEKKYFQFHTDDELRFFQRALDRNHGVFALGVVFDEDEDGDDVMMSRLQLMEITEYNMELGVDFGIFCTAQAVGRASLLELLDSSLGSSIDETDIVEEPLMAICAEYFDDQEVYYSAVNANAMARDVLQIITKLSHKEEHSMENSIGDEHDVKILHDVFDGEDQDDCEDDEETRKDRFAQAYLDSMECDSQGYISSASSRQGTLSWKEMNAISWAAFSSALNPSEDATYRLHAFDQDKITDRLKLATYWLSDVVQEVEKQSNAR